LQANKLPAPGVVDHHKHSDDQYLVSSGAVAQHVEHLAPLVLFEKFSAELHWVIRTALSRLMGKVFAVNQQTAKGLSMDYSGAILG
jgi:hypothetical protein